MTKSMLIDITKCLGCNACTQACKMANNVPEGVFRSTIHEYEIGEYPNVTMQFVKSACKHCLDPACASACTVGALRKTPEGPVVYDSDKCIGCRYCMYACPFEVPKFIWNDRLSLISKCDLCVERADGGTGPACAEACPFGAITYGDRDQLLQEAHRRIQAHPDRYINHVYGEYEAGGLSILYMSAVPFAQLGFPELGKESPAKLNRLVMHGTPTVAAGMALALSGVYWTIKRRMRMQETLEQPVAAPEEES